MDCKLAGILPLAPRSLQQFHHYLCIFVPCSELRLMILYLPIYLQINRLYSAGLLLYKMVGLWNWRWENCNGIWQIPLRWVGKIWKSAGFCTIIPLSVACNLTGFQSKTLPNFNFFPKPRWFLKGLACSFHDTRKTMKGVVCKRYFQIFENAKNYGYQ